jgi:DNA polymerase III delta subunit
MLIVHYGTDTAAVREAAFAAVGDTTPDIVTGEEYVSGQLADLVGGTSLFGEARVNVIDTPTEEMREELVSLLPAMADSDDRFIVIEGPLLAPEKKRYAKHTDDFVEHTAIKAERFNTFALADALAQRKKKQLWLLLQQAHAAGITAEEIIGVLWWQLKSIRLAAVTQSAAEAGMKDFPYQKAKRALATIPLAEAERLSHELLAIYHQGHSGEVDLMLALEQWVLTL